VALMGAKRKRPKRTAKRGLKFRWSQAVTLVPFLFADPAWADSAPATDGPDPGAPNPQGRGSAPGNAGNSDDRAAPIAVAYTTLPATSIGVPEGFEDLDGPVETLFDVYFQEKRIGAVPGRLEDGYFTFLNPETVANKLPGVIAEEVRFLLSNPLGANENLRCLPGETEGCNVLPSGSTGIIVDPELFRVDLFLGREYRNAASTSGLTRLGDPISGLSVIQNIAASLSASGTDSELAIEQDNPVRFGFAADTLASLGRTSLVSRVVGTDERGLEVDELYAQHYFDRTRIAGGLVQTTGSTSLSGFRMYGAEISSFNGQARNLTTEVATPIDVVLPRVSRVEIYKDGTLYSALQYSAGLQQLDTTRLPVGSYPVRIVARDASGVVLDEVRSFTKAADLPALGETVYSVRAGLRAEDDLSSLQSPGESAGLFPASTSQPLVAGSVSRRLTASSAATAGLTMVDGQLFPEAEVQLYRGQLRATAAAAAGPDNQYSASAAVNFQLGPVVAAFSVRKTEARRLGNTDLFDPAAYRPFLQSEESVFGNLQTRLGSGSIGLRGSFSRSELDNDRYAAGLSYNHPIRRTPLGTGYLSFDAVTSDIETRIGLRLTFLRNAGRNASISSAFGGDQFSARREGGFRDGFYPAARVGYSKAGQRGDLGYSGSASAGIAGGDSTLLLTSFAGSRLGEADVSTGVSRLRDTDQMESFVTGNIRTGFVYSDNELQLGSRGFGDAAVRVKLETETQADEGDSFFQVLVDNQPSQLLKPGQTASIIVPAFTRSSISLSPVGAPSVDVDLSAREVPLYPGNVVSLSWEAVHVVAAFGRLVDRAGAGIAGAILNSGTDQAVSSENGYFSVTGQLGSPLQIRLKDGRTCGTVTIGSADGGDEAKKASILRMGPVACVPSNAGGGDLAAR
jgi:Mat/Ecp fimbriae outer membrane usher protein